MVGYNEDAHIISVKSVVSLSESQLRIFILKSLIRIISVSFDEKAFLEAN